MFRVACIIIKQQVSMRLGVLAATNANCSLWRHVLDAAISVKPKE